MSDPSSSSSPSTSSSTSSSSVTGTSGGGLTVHIKTLKGQSFPVRIAQGPEATVLQLQQAITDATTPSNTNATSPSIAAAGVSEPISLEAQRLIYKGKVLKGDKILKDYNIEDGDCLHLIVKSQVDTNAQAAATPASVTSAPATAAPLSDGMPSLTPNNVLPNVPPPPFTFGGIPGMFGLPTNLNGQPIQGSMGGGVPTVQSMNIIMPQVNGANGQLPPDLQSMLSGVLGSLGIPGLGGAQPNGPGGAGAGGPQQANIVIDVGVPMTFGPNGLQPLTNMGAGAGLGGVNVNGQPRVINTPFGPVSPNPPATNTTNVTAAASTPSPTTSSTSDAAASSAAASTTTAAPVNATSTPTPTPIPGYHPLLSVNAVRNFMTEVSTNFPRITSQPPLSMNPRATFVSAAAQQQPFTENLAGLIQLLSQSQALVTQVVPPVLFRVHNELEHLLTPISTTASTTASDSSAHQDTPANRVALQAQLRQLSVGIRRVGDSFRGLATLLEAVQIDPQSGAASLLILPPHLQPGRQVNVTSTPMMQLGMMQGIPGFGPTGGIFGPNGQPINMNPNPNNPSGGPNVQTRVMTFGPNGLQPMPNNGNAAGGLPPWMQQFQQQQQQQQQQPAQAAPQQQTQSASTTPSTTGSAAPATTPTPSTAATLSSAAAPSVTTSAPTPQQPFNLMSLLQQAGPLVGQALSNLQTPTSSGNAPNAATPSSSTGTPAQSPPNPMANIMQALGPMLAGLQTPTSTQSTQPMDTATSNAAATPTNPSASTPTTSAASAATTPAPNPMAGIMSAFGPMLSQMMSNPNSVGGGGNLQSVISNLMGSMGGNVGASPSSRPNNIVDVDGDEATEIDVEMSMEEDEQPASLFDMFFSTMMNHMQLTDLMGLASGNWSGLDRVHGPFRELLMDLLNDDDSDTNRELLSHSLASGVIDSMMNDAALSEVVSQRIAGSDPVRTVSPVVKRHVRQLLNVILDTPIATSPASPSGPPAFSARLQRWCREFCGEWLVVLGRCYSDGLTSSQRIAMSLVRTKLFHSLAGSPMQGFLPMVENSISSVLMRCAQQYQQDQSIQGLNSGDGQPTTGGPSWLQHLPESERQRWATTIQQDEQLLEQRYQTMTNQSTTNSSETTPSLYQPLSQTYAAGFKKITGRTAGENPNTDSK